MATTNTAPVLRARCVVGPQGAPCDSGGSPGAPAPQPCTGVVTFSQPAAGGPCLVNYTLSGLSPGRHGLHIHERADFSKGCASAGGHWNPHGKPHGGPPGDDPDAKCHAGDLGNIIADARGVAQGTIRSALLHLSGELSIVGRSVMVHQDEDDLGLGDHSEPGTNGKTSRTTGNAGARVGCGEIVRVAGADREIQPPTASTKRLLRLVRPLPIIGGSVAVWVIMFSYDMGRSQLPKQLLPCPPISLFTFQQPQQPVYAAVMCFAALLFLAMTTILHRALEPFVAADEASRSVLKSNFRWGLIAFAGLAAHAVIPLQSNILEVVRGAAEMDGQSLVHQMSALVFFGCSMKHAMATIQLYFSSTSLPMRWEVTKVSTVIKCAALATAGLGFPLSTYFHPAGMSAEETNTGGASQWSMVGALIAYYMTYSWDIHLVLRASEGPTRTNAAATAPARGHGHSHDGAPCHGHSHSHAD